MTTTMCRMLPVITDPDLVTLLDTITLIVLGRVAGGAELFPGRVVHLDPHTNAVRSSANPFIDAGARPSLKALSFAHWEPQKFTKLPTVGFPADKSPMTKAPTAVGANTVSTSEPHVLVEAWLDPPPE
jgi:hypothetical protein